MKTFITITLKTHIINFTLEEMLFFLINRVELDLNNPKRSKKFQFLRKNNNYKKKITHFRLNQKLFLVKCPQDYNPFLQRKGIQIN